MKIDSCTEEIIMYPYKESLLNLEYFKDWSLRLRLCKKYTKRNMKIYFNKGNECDVLF